LSILPLSSTKPWPPPQLIEYYDIDVENELIEEVKAHSEINVATLNKIGL